MIRETDEFNQHERTGEHSEKLGEEEHALKDRACGSEREAEPLSSKAGSDFIEQINKLRDKLNEEATLSHLDSSHIREFVRDELTSWSMNSAGEIGELAFDLAGLPKKNKNEFSEAFKLSKSISQHAAEMGITFAEQVAKDMSSVERSTDLAGGAKAMAMAMWSLPHGAAVATREEAKVIAHEVGDALEKEGAKLKAEWERVKGAWERLRSGFGDTPLKGPDLTIRRL
jgi:hypothetical protein